MVNYVVGMSSAVKEQAAMIFIFNKFTCFLVFMKRCIVDYHHVIFYVMAVTTFFVFLLFTHATWVT